LRSRQTSKAEEAENARREAILRNDTAALDQLIANSLVTTLDSGEVKTKADEVAINHPTPHHEVSHAR
jgi:hypothetical protein